MTFLHFRTENDTGVRTLAVPNNRSSPPHIDIPGVKWPWRKAQVHTVSFNTWVLHVLWALGRSILGTVFLYTGIHSNIKTTHTISSLHIITYDWFIHLRHTNVIFISVFLIHELCKIWQKNGLTFRYKIKPTEVQVSRKLNILLVTSWILGPSTVDLFFDIQWNGQS